MNLRSIGINALWATAIVALMGLHSNAQVGGSAQANSATHVAAEMTKGKLNPAETKPGDKVALRLKEDVKSNGEVVLTKGATVDGVVKSVKRVDGKSGDKGQAQSMMEIEWLAPAAQGKDAQQLSIALQSVTQVNPLYQRRQAESSGDDWGTSSRSSIAGSAAGSVANSSGSAGGGLLGGVGSTVGGVVGATTGVAADVAGSAGAVTSTAAANTSARAAGHSNAALLNMPTVVAADHQTTASLENTFGMSSSSQQLFKVGRGELVSAGGSKQSLDIFSHLSNDTLITSSSKNFEISSGAQMQLLVGVNKK